MRIKQAVCYPIFKTEDMSFDTLFSGMAEIGFPAVELWTRQDDFDEMVAASKKHGLAIASMGAHHSLDDGLNKRSNHDRIEREIIESIDIAVELDIPGVICLAGNQVPHQTDVQAVEAIADGLRRVAPYAEQKGINLNLEVLNTKVDHPGYVCEYTEWGLAVVERVNSPRVKIQYDVYHMQIMEGDVIRTIRDNIGNIGHIHTAGVPGRMDIDETQELNYAAICKAIAETGYDLYVGHEFTPKGDIFEAYRKAFGICDQG